MPSGGRSSARTMSSEARSSLRNFCRASSGRKEGSPPGPGCREARPEGEGEGRLMGEAPDSEGGLECPRLMVHMQNCKQEINSPQSGVCFTTPGGSISLPLLPATRKKPPVRPLFPWGAPDRINFSSSAAHGGGMFLLSFFFAWFCSRKSQNGQ